MMNGNDRGTIILSPLQLGILLLTTVFLSNRITDVTMRKWLGVEEMRLFDGVIHGRVLDANPIIDVDTGEDEVGCTLVPTLPPTLARPPKTPPPTLQPKTLFPTLSTTETPSRSPTSTRGPNLRDTVASVVTGDGLDTPDSPEYQALQWITNEDEAALDPAHHSAQKIQERYILAVLYFSTRGSRWSNGIQFLSSASICAWNAIGKGIACDDNGFVKGVDLSDNGLSGDLPMSIFKIRELRWLILSANPRLGGSITDAIGDAQNLIEISLTDCQFGGTIPNAFGLLEYLAFVRWTNNVFTGTIPSSLTALPFLEVLDVTMNSLTGTVPQFDPRNDDLAFVHMYGNQLSGPLDTWLASINPRRLTALLAGGAFTGTLPTLLGTFTSMKRLTLEYTNLNGPIPTEIGNMRSMEVLQLPNSGLDGTIPTEIGRMSGLFLIKLSRNELTGTIPTELGGLQYMGWLFLSDNSLGGTVPTELGNIPFLGELEISRNEAIVDDITDIFCDPSNPEIALVRKLVADCGGTNPPLICPCCLVCCEVGGGPCFWKR